MRASRADACVVQEPATVLHGQRAVDSRQAFKGGDVETDRRFQHHQDAHCVGGTGAERLERDREAFDARCLRVREDGAYVDAGENDNLIVQKLGANPDALGIFGYSYLEENGDAVRGVAIGGVPPTYQAIADGRYPGARPLYVYVKRAHLRAVPGLRRFLELYAANWMPGGPLTRRGLIPSPAGVRAHAAATIRQNQPLDPRVLD